MTSFSKTLLVLISLATACALSVQSSAQTIKLPKDKDIRKISKWMVGSFDTFAQVDEDEEKNTPYQHTRALVHVVPINVQGLNNGVAFYVENQASNARTKPYRQRVYFLYRDQGKNLIMQVYRIKNDAELINAYQKPELLRNLAQDRLTHEAGCDIVFDRVSDKLYRGQAGQGKTCKSSLRGATYATSQTDLSETQWVNLDQGFDDSGAHKWGPPPGTIGHIFIRRKR